VSSKNNSQAEPESIRYVNLYESEGKVYTRKISGFYQSIRRYTCLPLILGYVLLPWLIMDGRPSILFDLPARKFHILWLTFWPQDFMLLAWLLIISAFALFTVTAMLGRVWCGFTCPQTVWSLMFMSVEHMCEGDRNKQIKLDKQGWSTNKVLRKGTKHFLWLLIAFITGVTFVGYFVPIRDLLSGLLPYRDEFGMLSIGAHPVAIFWTLFFTGMTYLNAGWLREQVCKYMCPYARFQSVMYDKDTLAVHYDVARGESRGARKIGSDYKAKNLGDCTDCSWCVQVCPVDIDIRDGLQYSCINCGLCVDACNMVMDKMDYPRGLVRFTSEDQLENGKMNFVRIRLLVYLVVIALMSSAFIYTVYTRTPLSMDIIRDRGTRLYRLRNDRVQNVYTLKVYNMDRDDHIYSLKISGDYPFALGKHRPIQIKAGGASTVPVNVSVSKNKLDTENTDVTFYLESTDNDTIAVERTSPFLGPKK